MKYDATQGLFVNLEPADIEKIEYVHGLEPVESIRHAYNRLKCQIIINANFFNMRNGKTCGEVVDEGEVLSHGMSGFGYGFINKKIPKFGFKNDIKATEFCGGYPCLLRRGEIFIDTKEPGFSGKSTTARGRTAIGTTPSGNFIIRAIADSDRKNKLSIKNLALAMRDYGCDHAINLDGGGSTQWITPWGEYISGRSVDGFIAIWLKNKDKDKITSNNENFVKGEIVTFTGGNVYSSATALRSSKVINQNSRCKITAIYSSGKHPYHCISQDGKGVYGWVDAQNIRREKIEENKDPFIEAWNKAKQKGILDGSNPKNPVTREQLSVILDRLHLLD